MSLRYRLFLMVSGLFVVISVCSYFIENSVTRNGLKKAQAQMRSKILDLSEKHRVDLQEFLAIALAENQEKINAILVNLSNFTPQMLRFAPTTNNSENGTWKEAADIVAEYKWLDYLQNTNEGKVTSEIIPRMAPVDPALRISIDEDLSWIYFDGVEAGTQPYLGIRIPYVMTSRSSVNSLEIPQKVIGMIPEAYLLFDVQKMASLPKDNTPPIFHPNESQHPLSIPVKWTEGYEIEMLPLIRAFQRARTLLMSKKINPAQMSAAEISQKMAQITSENDKQLNPISTSSFGMAEKMMHERLEEIALNYTQVSLIWALIGISESGLFGQDLFSFPMPSAITLFHSKMQTGFGVETKNVLFSTPFFDDRAYFASNPPRNSTSNLSSSLAIIPMPHSNHVYLGNTAQFIIKAPVKERVGYLTLGVDANEILQRLVLAIHQAILMVHEGKPILAYGGHGEQLGVNTKIEMPFSEMLAQKSGTISWHGENYFFMHLQPFPNVDLHFFLLNPEEIQFALLRELEAGSRAVIYSVLLNIHVAGLIALFVAILLINRISRKVTKPIIQLAKATEEVAAGRLDQVQLSLPPLRHNDEVAVLCHAFEDMVTGLKEKEKVKGVLNKVVSSEIAQEILKGNIHLGGEEKKVTVLFGDIREFTKMTQNMQAQEVIDLLNTCMTKVSSIIDKNGGVIDKFVGDECMALFGAPISHEDAALKAVIAAWEMMVALKDWNTKRCASNLPVIEMGFGIHTGPMLVGNMGAENRLNYTVIGSNVNLASRVCSAAKRMEILITKDTLDEPFIKDKILYEALPSMTFKGFDKQIEIFRVTGIKE